MTSATETMDTAEPTDAPGGLRGLITNPAFGSLAIRGHFLISSLFLIVGLALLGLATAKVVWPGLLAETALFSFGRIWPMALCSLVFGWLTIGLAGITLHAVPRSLGVPLALPAFALGNLLLMAAATAYGVAVIGLGQSEGAGLGAMPLFADGPLLLSYLTLAGLVTLTARRADRSSVPLSCWYLIAAPWWLVASYAVGAAPDLTGIPGEVQAAFSSTAIIGLWIAAATVGAGYYLVSRRVPEAAFNGDLGRIGFYSLAFTWVWTTGISFQYGPTGDWFETLPIVFGVGLAVGVVAILADLAMALRGRWATVAADGPLFLFTLGSLLFGLVPILMLTQSLRSGSAIVRFTRFDTGVFIVAVVGAFTLCAMAAMAHVLDEHRSGGGGGRVLQAVGLTVFGGTVVAAGSQMIAGLQQGLTWLAIVQDGRVPVGDDFAPSVVGVRGLDRATTGSLAIVLAAASLFALWVLLRSFARSREEADRSVASLTTARLRTVGRAVVLLFAVGALGAYYLPAVDADSGPSILAERSRAHAEGSLADQGRSLYLTEGCVYCHTQEVRPIVTDARMGTVSDAGDYAFDPAGISGFSRIGPDLAHAGSRSPTDSPLWIRDHLIDPRAARSWSSMPSYAHLTDDELTALSVYVSGLE
ncbi:MAG TPA: cbb3-type cytochrome c oxidase subunit II [Acidimicrobiia bacterium]|nr:cbb3-type cytochrome c oxidase subunit II [Acidimicrobiia bacterium]